MEQQRKQKREEEWDKNNAVASVDRGCYWTLWLCNSSREEN